MGSKNATKDWLTKTELDLEALVIGGGFSGIYLLHKLRELGLNAKIFEAGKEIGGVWNWNRYPGARVDSEVPYYQFSLRQVWKDWTWSERFPGHEEIRRYFKHAADVLDLHDHIALEENIIDCTFDQKRKKWVVKSSSGKIVRCTYLIVAGGSSYKRHYPDFSGINDYKGVLLHASHFPEEGYNFAGKKVAVVGQGATGIQIVQEVSKQASEITVFVRTPNFAIPMRQRRMTAEEQNQYKSIYESIFRASRSCASGLPYFSDGKASKDVPDDERLARWEELWARGGFNFNIANYRDYLFDQEANDKMYDFWKSKVRARVYDPAKRDVIAPEKPPHPFGTKRPSLEQDYYECINQKNLNLIDLNTISIQKFQKDGIQTSDGKLHEADIVFLATGYDAVTGSFTGMGLKDTEGVDLKEKWKDGVRTYLGMTCPGLPNMFMVYSPQAPTALSNGTTAIEIQGDWIAAAIGKMRREGISAIEARPEAAEKWAADIQTMNQQTLFPLTNSWYMGSNIPGKKREQLNYLAGLPQYESQCTDALKDWSGFDLVKA